MKIKSNNWGKYDQRAGVISRSFFCMNLGTKDLLIGIPVF